MPTHPPLIAPEHPTKGAAAAQLEASPPLQELAARLVTVEQYESALQLYELALEEHPQDVLATLGKGNTLLFLKRPAEALSVFENALHLDHTCALAYEGQALALSQLGRNEEALIAYEAAIQQNPSFAPSYFGKAHVFLLLKRPLAALWTYWRARHLKDASD